ncbi:MAG: PilZ domain-containing protein, partial [Planctomycetota bacterium]
RLDLPISITMEDGDHEAKIRDVSRGGVCFFLDRPIAEMTALRVEFELPTEHGRRTITGDGAVVRCERISRTLEHYEIAVFVQNMAAPDRETIERYVASIRD